MKYFFTVTIHFKAAGNVEFGTLAESQQDAETIARDWLFKKRIRGYVV